VGDGGGNTGSGLGWWGRLWWWSGEVVGPTAVMNWEVAGGLCAGGVGDGGGTYW
jgi:hypothetical protein